MDSGIGTTLFILSLRPTDVANLPEWAQWTMLGVYAVPIIVGVGWLLMRLRRRKRSYRVPT